jgi:KRAB domain-containing zinc finger protein
LKRPADNLDYPGLHNCHMCSSRYNSAQSLHLHIQATHSPSGVIHPCPICKKNFVEGWRLKRHMRCHSSERPFKCDLCSMTFKRKDHLHDHKKMKHLFSGMWQNSTNWYWRE